MLREIATFLLEIPPLEEIGGKITHIIEQYRSGNLEKEIALESILTDYKTFLEKYIESNNSLGI